MFPLFDQRATRVSLPFLASFWFGHKLDDLGEKGESESWYINKRIL